MVKTVAKTVVGKVTKAKSRHPLYSDMVLEAIIFNGYKKVSRQAILKHVMEKYSLNFEFAKRNVKKALKQLLEDETILPSAEAGKSGAGSYKMMAASVHAYRNKESEVPKKKAKDEPRPRMKVAKKPKAVGSSSKRDVSKAKSKVEKVKSSGDKEKKSKSVK